MKKPVVSKIITGLFIANLYMISIQISFDKIPIIWYDLP